MASDWRAGTARQAAAAVTGRAATRPGRDGAGRTRRGAGAARRAAADGIVVGMGQVTTPRVRHRMITSATVPAAARLNTVMRAAVMIVLMKAVAMLTTPAIPTTAKATPSPLEVTPPPLDDPGLHMVSPSRADCRRC
jgi:hypothetical protein